jgi:hypothetical protein
LSTLRGSWDKSDGAGDGGTNWSDELS